MLRELPGQRGTAHRARRGGLPPLIRATIVYQRQHGALWTYLFLHRPRWECEARMVRRPVMGTRLGPFHAAEKLIVWTEPNGVDYALSFEDRAGCAEVWHFIEEVRGGMTRNADGESDPLTLSPFRLSRPRRKHGCDIVAAPVPTVLRRPLRLQTFRSSSLPQR